MTESEIAEFLESHGVGTLAFGNEEGAYAIPMSFGYDRAHDRCIFQFAFDDESLKRRYVEADRTVCLSVFEWNDVTDWRSVVIMGDLNDLEGDANPKAASVFAAYARVATLEVFDTPLEELDLSWYSLYIHDKRGRKAAP